MRGWGILGVLVAAGVIGCGGGGGGAGPALTIQTFDTLENGWGDAPLPVHFVWRIQAPAGKTLTCKVDVDGDGAIDSTITPCPADTTSTAAAALVAQTFTIPGPYAPTLVVSDGSSSVTATTSVFANHVTFGPNVVFPEQLPGFVAAQVLSPASVTLTFATAANVPALAAGTILWGTSAGGYLLTVAAASPSGAAVTVQGTAAKIEDAIDTGFFGARNVPATFEGASCALGAADCAGVTFQTVPAAPAFAASTDGTVRTSALSLSGQVGVEISIPIEDGVAPSLGVTLTVERFVIDIEGHSLKRADFAMTPLVTFGLTVEVAKANLLTWPKGNSGAIKLGTMLIGPFVVVPAIFPSLTVSASVEASMSLGLGLPVSITYESGTWTSKVGHDAKPAASLIKESVSVSDSIEASLQLKLEALVFGIGGPYVAPAASLSLKSDGMLDYSCASDPMGKICYEATWGLSGSYGAEVPWIDDAKIEGAIEGGIEEKFWDSCEDKAKDKAPDDGLTPCGGASGAAGSGAGGMGMGAMGGGAAAGGRGGAGGAGGQGDQGGQGGGASAPPRPDPTKAPQVPYKGVAMGDPHLRTFDGVRYDEQPVGETVLVRSASGDFELQARTKPWNGSTRVAVIVGAAARVGADRFSVYLDGTVRLNDALLAVPDGQQALSAGVTLFRAGSTFVLVWPDGAQARFTLFGPYMGVEVYLPDTRRGQVGGLLGNDDGDPTGELMVRNGPVLPDAPTLSYFYGVFIESWRVAQADSLFYYGPGETTETFTDRMFPPMPARAMDLDPAARASAAAICTAAGVSADWLDACIVDVGFTNDPSFAGTLTNLSPVAGAVDVHPGTGAGTDGSVITSADDSSGTITGTLAPGATQTYTLAAQKGQVIVARLADTGRNTFVPRLTLLDPTGAAVQGNYGADVAGLAATAATAGTYSLVVADASGRTDVTGSYTLYFVVAPGANEGGLLPPSATVAGTIELGDLDSYTFAAAAGQGVQVRVADVSGGSFVPAVAVYDPTGALVNSNYGQSAAGFSFTASATGTYTVVVFDYSSGFASSGAYHLYLAVAPGANEGGLLPPSAAVAGTIDLGDIDSYTFAAVAGQGVQVRAADVTGTAFVPAVVVYDPSGAVVNSNYGQSVAGFSFTASATGIYTVVVYDYSSGFASAGAYNLYLTVAPGANEGGLLPPAAMAAGMIDLGDLDSYTFAASTGQGVQIRVGDVSGTSFVPAVVVYGPTGALVDSNYGQTAAGFSFTASATGTYTAVVYDYSSGFASTGTYNLYLTVAPGANEGGALTPGTPVAGAIDLADLDSFTFAGVAGQRGQVVVTDTAGGPFVPAVVIYGPTGAVVISTYNAAAATANFNVTASGTYTAVVYDYSSGFASSGSYTLLLTLQ